MWCFYRCQDTMIGGSFVRGVSGGERKRVCIGNEIIINPSLLFLDEPTSGLDSTTALRTVEILHDIAEVWLSLCFHLRYRHSTSYMSLQCCGYRLERRWSQRSINRLVDFSTSLISWFFLAKGVYFTLGRHLRQWTIFQL